MSEFDRQYATSYALLLTRSRTSSDSARRKFDLSGLLVMVVAGIQVTVVPAIGLTLVVIPSQLAKFVSIRKHLAEPVDLYGQYFQDPKHLEFDQALLKGVAFAIKSTVILCPC